VNSTERAFSESIFSLIPRNSKVVVAFSGGCDSLALLCLCAKVLGTENTHAVYVNHGLRSAAELEREVALNRSNCGKLGVGLTVRALAPGEVKKLASERKGGTEDAARVLRYRILVEERERLGASFILTAHHRQDQIETIVMRLRRGAPPSSLGGIRTLDEDRRIARPLLDFTRAQLESYLTEQGLKWSIDSTNSDTCFERNEVRNDIIPAVQAIFPDFDRTVLGLGKSAENLGKQYNTSAFEKACVDMDLLRDLSTSGRAAAIFAMWDHVFDDGSESRTLPMTLLRRILRALSEGRDANVGSNGALFSIYRGKLYLVDLLEEAVYADFDRVIDVSADNRIALPGGMHLLTGSEASAYVEERGLNTDLVLAMQAKDFRGPVHIRFAREGEKIRLRGGSRPVGKLLQNMEIPASLRGRVPVLSDDEGLCAVFCSAFGGRDRICVKFVSSIARNGFPLYIVSEG